MFARIGRKKNLLITLQIESGRRRNDVSIAVISRAWIFPSYFCQRSPCDVSTWQPAILNGFPEWECSCHRRHFQTPVNKPSIDCNECTTSCMICLAWKDFRFGMLYCTRSRWILQINNEMPQVPRWQSNILRETKRKTKQSMDER